MAKIKEYSGCFFSLDLLEYRLIINKNFNSMKELDKNFEAQKSEDKLYQKWEASGFFNPDICIDKGIASKDAPTFSMVLPPPNVTGILHAGHASMLAIEDLMVRYHRMKGDRTLWLPGTDHAAIATQTKVEKLLIEKGMSNPKNELGREKFLAEVAKFAQASHDTIINQSKKMGSSMDWSREAYTLDEKRNLAVRTVFKKMYDDGLIERGYRIVNWCPRCHSTIADDEVEHKEQSAKIYTFKYSADFPISIATTRPETKLGDTAIAVNPTDERYAKYIGQEFLVTAFAGGADLKIKIIADAEVDMNFGTGAVGVTPAHSYVDYEMGKKNDLEVIKVIDEDGKMTALAGEIYQGLGVKEARKKVVEYLREHNLLTQEQDQSNNLSVCYRCETAIEPLPSRQWFIKVNKKFKIEKSKIDGIESGQETTLKELMQKSVRSGQIQIIPDFFEKTYFHWIDNLHDWCISRQIWYGHQLPVWYRGEEIFVGMEAPTELGWEQDPDTLDTWFSSGLWTFSTLGWPEETADMRDYHPTSVLETGYDILPFWVARMILMTTYVLGDIPFKTVYLHGLVRDEQGRKMSKSLGNVIDPLDTIAKYGADATRLSLVVGNTPGNDLKLSEEKISGFRNFTTKLWNISRFILLSIEDGEIKNDKDNNFTTTKKLTAADVWILNRLEKTITDYTKNIESFNYSLAGEILREFTWSDLADWYLEAAKIEGEKSEILIYLLNTLLKLWHPFMPFVTEAIWQEMYGERALLMVEKWPKQKIIIENNNQSEAEFELIKNIVTGIRSLRSEYKIEPVKKVNVSISAGQNLDSLKNSAQIIRALGRLEDLVIEPEVRKPDDAVGFVLSGMDIYINMSGLVDFEKEKKRLQSEIAILEKYVSGIQGKLANEEFVKNAPAAIVEKENEKLSEAKEKITKMSAQLNSIV
jgi:valyl-tRNA synthetase